MHMIKRAFSAIRRFKHNIWMASLDSGFVTACIGVVYSFAAIVALLLIIAWPWPVLAAMVTVTVVRLIYAGVTAQ